MKVHEALVEVMKTVGAVRKGDRNQQQGFSFRGVDAVTSAVYPALVKHGVVVIPKVITYQYGTVTVGRNRTEMGHVQLTIEYRFIGPEGDSVESVVVAESMDAGDKATAKAHSVAFRTALLQTLCLPTDDVDPDATNYQRSDAAPTADVEQQDAIGELATACAALGLDNRDAAQRFYTAFGTTVREASADQIREFVKALHTNGVPAEIQGDLMDLVPTGQPLTKPQLQKLAILRQEAGYNDDDDGRVDWFQYVQTVIGRLVSSNKDLTKDEAIALITALQKTKEPTS